jgi:hypothetical protein
LYRAEISFYAVMEKKKEVGEPLEPNVSACTKEFDTKLEIHVKDDGSGIPKSFRQNISAILYNKTKRTRSGIGIMFSYDIKQVKAKDQNSLFNCLCLNKPDEKKFSLCEPLVEVYIFSKITVKSSKFFLSQNALKFIKLYFSLKILIRFV